MSEKWFVRTTATDGSTSITYGPDLEWAKRTVAACLDRPGIESAEGGLISDLENEEIA